MNMQQESSLYSLTSNHSKVHKTEKLSLLIWQMPNQANEFIHQIFINYQQLLYLGGEWNIYTKLTGAAPVENSD